MPFNGYGRRWATSWYEGDINSGHENLHGWHTNAGMTYWWGDTFGNGQYSDQYWPTVDPYRLPGTTVSRKVLANGAGTNYGTTSQIEVKDHSTGWTRQSYLKFSLSGLTANPKRAVLWRWPSRLRERAVDSIQLPQRQYQSAIPVPRSGNR